LEGLGVGLCLGTYGSRLPKKSAEC
jgi:hypothetical protein